MAKQNMSELLKNRMTSTKQASELAASDEAYEKIFRESPPTTPTKIAELPLDLLDPFSAADIGFRPYSPQKLKVFAEQLREEGLFVRIIVRQKADGRYEILAGHNRVAAARLA
ncbi:MAG: ParB N-terminal domain-containing protein, partial [Oscillospiraceae bacterium]|nr:ParB N-terminal domain-containing protein [Oscillospiraceae bacterium]